MAQLCVLAAVAKVNEGAATRMSYQHQLYVTLCYSYIAIYYMAGPVQDKKDLKAKNPMNIICRNLKAATANCDATMYTCHGSAHMTKKHWHQIPLS